MPRNTSGTYTLPTGNPVVTGTVIQSAWANTTMEDIAAALTGSLDRSGRGGMAAPVRGIDGTTAAPAYSFTDDTDTGMYREPGELNFSLDGVKMLSIGQSGVTIDGDVIANNYLLPGGGGSGAAVVVQDTAPTNPAVDTLWINSETGRLLLWYQDPNTTQWMELGPAPGGVSGGGGGGDGEVNNGVNLDASPQVYAGMLNEDLTFRSVFGTAAITVTENPTNLTLTVIPSAIDHQTLGGAGTIDHSQLDDHYNNVQADPHPQYVTTAEGDANYAPISHVGSRGPAQHAIFLPDDILGSGFVPPSTAADVTAQRVLGANGQWIDQGAGSGQANDLDTPLYTGTGDVRIDMAYTGGPTLNLKRIVQGDNLVITESADSIGIGAPNVISSATQVIAGQGMTGGGSLTADVTLDVIGGTGITVNANNIEVDGTVQLQVGGATAGNFAGLDVSGNLTDSGFNSTSFAPNVLVADGALMTRAAGVYSQIPISGSAGDVLTVVGGAPTWQAPAGGGNVTAVGLPVDGQIGVWTGGTTIEGDAALTFDTTADTLTIAASGNLNFGAVPVLNDAAGLMTLQNIDALDATTTATIEAALPSLVPQGGTTGQVLTKQSNTDYDTDWETPSAGGGTFYQTVEDTDTPVAQEPVLNFEGAGVTVTPETGKTTVTIPGGAGGGISTTNQSWAIVEPEVGKTYPGNIILLEAGETVSFESFAFRSTTGSVYTFEFFKNGVSLQPSQSTANDGTVNEVAVSNIAEQDFANQEYLELQVENLSGPVGDLMVSAKFVRTRT